MLRHRLAAVAVSLTLLTAVAGCSSDSDGASPTATTAPAPGETTTSPPDTDPGAEMGAEAAYAERGPNEVGVHSFALEDGRRVVAWYPADPAAAEQPNESFDIASLLSPNLQSQIPADKRPVYEIRAHPGAEPAADGPYPVVLFSHGFAGFPEQSADLVTHLASWGFVVVAPDHVERSLSGLLGVAAKDVAKLDDVEVISQSLDAAVADAEAETSPLNGLLDLDQVAAAGHSAGAGAAYRAATEERRVKAFISYSLGTGETPGSDVEPPPVSTIPGMVMAGSADETIPIATSRAVFDEMAAPKYFVSIEGAGHLVFSDICLIGRDQGGLVGLIDEIGLDIGEQFTRLASDGCREDDLDPAEAFSAIDHLSVAFLRSTFGIDPEPVGLDPAVTENFTDAEVTLTAEPG